MKTIAILLFQVLVCLQTLRAQSDSFVYITLIADTMLSGVQQNGNYVVPVFADSNINNITNQYNFTVFEQAFPSSPHWSKVSLRPTNRKRLASEKKSLHYNIT